MRKNLALWIIIGLLLIALFNLFQGPGDQVKETELAFSSFVEKVDNGEIQEVTIRGNEISGRFADGSTFNTYAPNEAGLIERLEKAKVLINARPGSATKEASGMPPIQPSPATWKISPRCSSRSAVSRSITSSLRRRSCELTSLKTSA